MTKSSDAPGADADDDALRRLDAWRRLLLAPAIEAAAFDGWSPNLLATAEAEAGLPAGAAALACPAGVVDLIDFWALEHDRATLAALAALDLPAMKIRDRVRAGVAARVETIGAADREALRRALARLAFPDAAARGTRILWRAADTIWRAIGDRSTDGNHYSKRAILSGVIAQTMAAWAGGDDAAAWRVLDRRIEDVMRFERFKSQARKRIETAPSIERILARVRYGRGPRA